MAKSPPNKLKINLAHIIKENKMLFLTWAIMIFFVVTLTAASMAAIEDSTSTLDDDGGTNG